jgi:hypothetical protein
MVALFLGFPPFFQHKQERRESHVQKQLYNSGLFGHSSPVLLIALVLHFGTQYSDAVTCTYMLLHASQTKRVSYYVSGSFQKLMVVVMVKSETFSRNGVSRQYMYDICDQPPITHCGGMS